MLLSKYQSPFSLLLKLSGVVEPFLWSIISNLSGLWVKLWLMITYWSDCVRGKKKYDNKSQYKRTERFVASLIYFEESSYLEAVEFGFVGDVGEMVHVFKEPVVRFSRGQQSHPAKLMCHSLLQIRNSTGTCDYDFKNNSIVDSYKDSRPVLQHTFLCLSLLCEMYCSTSDIFTNHHWRSVLAF